MNAKHLVPLAAVAVVSVAATAWVLQTSTQTVASDRRGESVVPSLLAKANDLTGLSVRDGNGTVAVELRDNRYVAAESGYPIKTDSIRDVIASSAELAFEEARTADPNRYGDLGLADPGDKNASEAGKEITFRTAGGELADFVVGKTDSTTGSPAGGVFIRVKGQPQTFLARGNVRLPATRSDWYVPFDLDVKRSEVKKVELAGGGRDGLTATAKADKPGTLELADVPEKRAAEDFKVSRLATLVESFTFQDVRKATKPADDARKMTVDAGNGLRFTFTSLGAVSDGWVQVAAEATEDAAKDKAKLIMSKVEGYDFRLPSNLAEALGWTMADVTNEQKDPQDKGGGPGGAGLPPGLVPGGGRLPPGLPPGLIPEGAGIPPGVVPGGDDKP
jgi:Domain of unknown function (DUF4340)